MDLVTIDFETYYDKEYSLTKMTTEEYIRSPKFEVIGLGIKVGDQSPIWCDRNKADRVLRGIDFSDKAILCHNTLFDGAILSWKYDVRPRMWFDTVSMARALHAVQSGASLEHLAAYYKIGTKGTAIKDALGKRLEDFDTGELVRFIAYCLNDVDLCYKLFNIMKRRFTPNELILIDRSIRMYTEPVIDLDTKMLADYLVEVQNSKSGLVQALGWTCTEEEAMKRLRSNEQFAELLTALEVEVPMKVSRTTGKQTYAFSKTDRAFLKLQEHDDPAVVAIVEARLGVKTSIEQTRTQRLLSVAQRGTLPVMLRYYAAHTGRFGGGDKMNLQNLKRGGTLRKALRAPKGKVFVACDSSQIEARVVAWLAGQKDLLEAFRQGRDVYSEFATDVYGKKITKADKVERFCGKTCILGLGYGMGWEKFIHTLAIGQGGISIQLDSVEGRRIVQMYRHKYHKIAALWRMGDRWLYRMVLGESGETVNNLQFTPDGYILPNGLMLQYPGLNSTSDGFRYINDQRVWREMLKCRVLQTELPEDKYAYVYGGKTIENYTQALARIVVADQLVEISHRYPVALQVHDENVCVVDEAEADEALAFMIEVMSKPPAWAPDLPVACEGGHGPTYGDCK